MTAGRNWMSISPTRPARRSTPLRTPPASETTQPALNPLLAGEALGPDRHDPRRLRGTAHHARAGTGGTPQSSSAKSGRQFRAAVGPAVVAGKGPVRAFMMAGIWWHPAR